MAMIMPASTNTTIAPWIQIHDGDTGQTLPVARRSLGGPRTEPARRPGAEPAPAHQSGVLARNRGGASCWRIAAVEAGSLASLNGPVVP